eukprot:sb/3467926/
MILFAFVCYVVVVSRGLSDDKDGGCPIAVDNGFLVRSCQDQEVSPWDGILMKCLNSSTMYYKMFTVDVTRRAIKPYVTTLCPNDSIQYQACGSNSLGPANKLFQTSPVCGKLCYDHDKDCTGFTRHLKHVPELIAMIVGVGSYCGNGWDQTNCSDPAKIAGSCHIGGHLSTVSIYILCRENSMLCDNDMHKKCPTLNRHCTIHKHQLCNGQDDCAMGADERKAMCFKLTQRSCVRSFSQNQGLLRIPVDWVQDGEVDCLDGEDEKVNWQTCGKGIRKDN